MVERVLSRSADYPIDVTLDLVMESSEEEEEELMALNRRFGGVLFSHHLYHIESLVIRGSISVNLRLQLNLDYIFHFSR